MKNVMVVLVLCAVAGMSGTVQAENITLTLQDGLNDYTGTSDTFVTGTSSEVNYNFGASGGMYTGNYDSTHGPYRALVKFDLGSLPAGVGAADIVSATLKLWYYNASGAGGAIEVSAYRAASNWGEGTSGGGVNTGGACWNYAVYNTTQWSNTSTDGGDFYGTSGSLNDTSNPYDTETGCASGSGRWNDWSLTNMVKEWVGGTYTNYGVTLVSPNAEDDPIYRRAKWYTADFTTADKRPILEIVYVPEPCTMSILGVGLIAGGLLRKRRR